MNKKSKQDSHDGVYPMVSTPTPTWLRPTSVIAVALAALVSLLVVAVRPDHAEQQGGAVDHGNFSVSVVLPSLGSGAPLRVDSLELHTFSLNETSAAAIYQRDPSSAVTAARYASHLIADFVNFSDVFSQPLDSPAYIQAALATAITPQLIRGTQEIFTEGLSDDAVLLARLGLPPGSDLPAYFSYDVQRGDSVAKLASRFGLEPESITNNNWEIVDANYLEPKTRLTIPTTNGIVYTVNLGDTLLAVVEKFQADLDATVAYPGNNLLSADSLIEGGTILLVDGLASATLGFDSGPIFAIPDFVWPMGGVVTDLFGTPRGNRFGYHTGVDFAAPAGTFVASAAPGIVIQAGWAGSFGLNVLVDHGGGVITRYAHLSHIDVFLGQFVDTGTLLGFVGSTGHSTGNHLHFEIIMGGTPVDPLNWLN